MKQITYGKWGRMGRLGNQLFELAALNGMSNRYGRELFLPVSWKYQPYFKNQIKIGTPIDTKRDICEPCYEFSGWEYWDSRIGGNVAHMLSISGWLQSSKYFNKEQTKKLFEFDSDFKANVELRAEDVVGGTLFSKPIIMVGFRVGQDYVENGNYEILPPLYQISALWKHFPDWRENYNVLVFSDDYQHAKLNMDCAENIFFASGFSDIEQLYLGTLCTHYILPNSTFSWWQAYLSQNTGITIRPTKYFKDYLAKICTTRDFWEEDWIEHDYRGEKINMLDVAFTVPIKHDHKDREDNYLLLYDWIRANFNTAIVLGEQGGDHFYKMGKFTRAIKFEFEEFHRTRMLKQLAQSCFEPIIVNMDADNICPIMQITIAVDMLRKGEADGVYPYDGRGARVNRIKWYKQFFESRGDCGIFGGEIFRGTRTIDPLSVGHIVMWNREKFLEGGGENENFISYGPEDVERKERFEKLGYRIKRVKGIVYHIDHWCGPDSGGKNPYFGRNYNELERIRKMSKEELEKEISSWGCTKTKKAIN